MFGVATRSSAVDTIDHADDPDHVHDGGCCSPQPSTAGFTLRWLVVDSDAAVTRLAPPRHRSPTQRLFVSLRDGRRVGSGGQHCHLWPFVAPLDHRDPGTLPIEDRPTSKEFESRDPYAARPVARDCHER